MGIQTAVEKLASTSRALSPVIEGEKHYDHARHLQPTLPLYKALLHICGCLRTGEFTEPGQLAVHSARRIQFFLSQKFHVAE